jgi:hypothetical protein
MKMAKQQKNGSGSKKKSTGFLKESKNITNVTSTPENGEQRKKISEAAYFRALGRNFEGGDLVEDWLEAEKELGTA